MTGLTTHVLDTASGTPAEGLSIDLYRLNGEAREKLKTVVTNSDGRVDGGPILIGETFLPANTNWFSMPAPTFEPAALP